MRTILALLGIGLLLHPLNLAADQAPFARGADVGWLSDMEASGDKFYDASGMPGDCLQILKDTGINAIRLRVWVNPAQNWCEKDDVLQMAKRASSMGFRLMIDFHYSDTWADPQTQKKPAAWNDHDFAQLQKDVYDHTYDVLKALKDEGVTPEWVQVGNEITFGMLWPDGKASNMAKLVKLLNQGYAAVKAVDPAIQVVIHLNDGANNGRYRGWFDQAIACGLKFDVIGVSLYPEKKDWQGACDHCLANLKDLSERYGKGVMVCEIGFYASEPDISKKILVKMIKGCEALPQHKGLGLFYWEPEGYTKHYNRTAWQPDGKPSSAMEAFQTP